MKETLKLGGILAAITIVVALLLAGLNNITKPKIEEINLQKTKESIKTVLPNLGDQPSQNIENTNEVVEEILHFEGVGYAVTCSPSGYNGKIKMMVGLNEDLSVSGVNIIEMSETPGLGAKASDPSFLQQYQNKTEDIGVAKSNPKENEINAISGATITSKAVTNGVNEAIKAVKEGGAVNE